MVRNFQIRNRRPCWPTRSWRKNGALPSVAISSASAGAEVVSPALGWLPVGGGGRSKLADDDPDAVLILGERGNIEGEVKVPHVVLNGSVTGDVHATTSVELSSRARVNGSVFYRVIEMAMGAEVNGNLVHLEEEKATSDLSNQELNDDVKPRVEFEVKDN